MSVHSRRTAGPVRRRLAVPAALVALALVAAAGCGGSSGSGGGAAGAGPSGGEMTGELLVWDWDSGTPGFKAAFSEIDAAFQQSHPGVTIKRVVQPFAQYGDLLQATFTSQQGPCVAEMLAAASGPAVLRFAKGLVPLDSVLTDATRQDLTGLDVASAGFDPTKTVYGVPFGLQPQVMYYNKALFRRAGLDPERPPRTYADLVSAAAALKAKGIIPFGGGNKEGFLSEWWFSWLFPGTLGAQDSFDLAAGTIKFTDPRVKQVVQQYVDLAQKGYFGPGLASTPLAPDAADAFAAGKSAMFIGLGSGTFASYAPFDKALGTDNVGVMEAIGDASGQPKYLPAGPASTWGIPKYCKNQALAWQYINYITGTSASEALWKVGSIMPGNRKAQVGSDAPPQVQQMLRELRAAKTVYPAHGLWDAKVDADFVRQLQTVITGNQSVDAAMTKVQATQEGS